MQTSTRSTLTRLFLLGAALSLGACNGLEPGVDDYSNAQVDVRTAGKTLSGSFEQGKHWEAAIRTPTSPAAFGLSTQTQVLRKSTALPGTPTAGPGLEVDLSDTADGLVRVSNVVPGLFLTHYDSAVLKYDDKWKDGLPDNENAVSFRRHTVHAGGKTETLLITDADNDGQVTPKAGSDNQARFQFTTVQGGVTESADLVVGSGPDNDFDLEGDNTVYQAIWTRTKDGAEVARGELLDADGDGKVGDNAKDQIVTAKWYEINPPLKPWVRKTAAEARLKVFAHKSGDEPITFSASEELVTGRVNAISMKNRLGGDSIIKGDTMWVGIETTRSRSDDTLQHAEIVVIMNPGQDLKSDADDLCYAFHIKTQKRFGFERSAEFNFVAGEPVPHGKDPVSGTFDGKVTYANGQSATLQGEFSPSGFSAEYTGPDGNSVKVEFTKSGDVI